MSTALKSFDGLTEIPHPAKLTSSYLPAKLFLTRFWGGKIRGVSIQITLESRERYIQLDEKTAREFAKEILKALK